MKLPQNESAEKALLGILGLNLELIPEVTKDIFYNPVHAELFEILESLWKKKAPEDILDFTHIRAELESKGRMEAIGGEASLFEIFSVCLGQASFSYYHSILCEAASFRDFILKAEQGVRSAYSMRTPLPEIIQSIQDGVSDYDDFKIPLIKDQALAVLDEMERKVPHESFSTGLSPLDRLLGGGIHRKELLVIAAPTSRGKSLLLGQGALESSRKGCHVAYYSLEMPVPDLLNRLAANLSGFEIKPHCELSSPRSEREVQKILRAVTEIAEMNLTLLDNICDLDEILKTARFLKRKKGLDVLIVDYVQRVECSGDNREQAVAAIARKLKNFAMQNDVAVLTASQVNDDGQVRESRAIGHEADVLLHIADVKNETQISVAKFRRGRAGTTLTVTRKGELGRFEPSAVTSY